MVTHSSILAWETPRREEPGGLQSYKRSDTTQPLNNSKTRAVSTDGVFQTLPSVPGTTGLRQRRYGGRLFHNENKTKI